MELATHTPNLRVRETSTSREDVFFLPRTQLHDGFHTGGVFRVVAELRVCPRSCTMVLRMPMDSVFLARPPLISVWHFDPLFDSSCLFAPAGERPDDSLTRDATSHLAQTAQHSCPFGWKCPVSRLDTGEYQLSGSINLNQSLCGKCVPGFHAMSPSFILFLMD